MQQNQVTNLVTTECQTGQKMNTCRSKTIRLKSLHLVQFSQMKKLILLVLRVQLIGSLQVLLIQYRTKECAEQAGRSLQQLLWNHITRKYLGNFSNFLNNNLLTAILLRLNQGAVVGLLNQLSYIFTIRQNMLCQEVHTHMQKCKLAVNIMQEIPLEFM